MKLLVAILLVACSTPTSTSISAIGATSCSKLGPHVNGWTAAARQFAYACPPLVKFIGAGGVPIDAIAQVKQRCPASAVLLRMWTPKRWNGDPVADADAFWTDVFAPVRALPAHRRALIDYLEGPNEQDSTPAWPLVPGYRADYFNDFLVRFVQRASWAGFTPVVGSISVGNPGGDLDTEAVPALREIVPAIQAAASAGGGWSYHAYTNNASHDETYMALRYREYLARIPELRGIPLFLSEGGFDLGGNPDADGWQAQLSASQYLDWLRWFDDRLREDPEVVGVTLFAIGQGWPTFDLTPIAGALAAHVAGAGTCGCACRADVDNVCSYGPTEGCAATQPGGYCDPDGDGDAADADWVRGYYEHHDTCM